MLQQRPGIADLCPLFKDTIKLMEIVGLMDVENEKS